MAHLSPCWLRPVSACWLPLPGGCYANQRSRVLQNHKPSSLKDSWHILPFCIADQQRHIEYSEHLLASMSPGSLPMLYWSQAEPEALVLGFSQKSAVLNADALAICKLPVYQRRA